MEATIFTALGAVLVLALITFVGVRAGKNVKNASDFTTGSGMGSLMVAGSLIGTLVGGASTIGTAQLAFTYGLSAWWFTLGGGLGLLVMTLWFIRPLRESGLSTLPQILTKEYGKKVATAAAILMSVGTFISIVSQLLSGAALITSLWQFPTAAAVLLTVVLMLVYVFFGGAWGAGMVGIVKTVLLYAVTLVCGIAAIALAGGLDAFTAALPREQYFNLFARGAWKDGGAGASLIFGVLTTQAYFLPILSAKNEKIAKKGAIFGGILTIFIGLAGILVGFYMRIHFPDTPSASVLPTFVLLHLPDFIGGIILAALLVALVGTGAGLALGISSVLSADIYKPLRRKASEKEMLLVSRGFILLILLAAGIFACGEAGSMILNWSFLSMGLRGAVLFAPLCFALFLPGRVPTGFAAAAVLAGPVAVLLGNALLPAYIDPLFPGMAAALLICILGCFTKKKGDPR